MSEHPSILIVDDDPLVARLLRRHFEQAGYHARSVASGRAALDLITEAEPDLVILEPMLPVSDGYTICEEIRTFSRVPVVMLAAKGEEPDKVRGFEAGADDYLTKPFSPRELLARVRAVLRRTQQGASLPEPALLRCGPITIDVASARVTVAGEIVKLSPTEFRLLHQLALNTGKVLSHAQLLSAVWGQEYRGDRHYLWVYIGRLRHKIEPDPEHPMYLRSEPGFGYMLDCPPAMRQSA